MTARLPDPTPTPSMPWQANLALRFARRGDGTILAASRHEGPLRIQKALYPEGPELCHAIVLHPPAGIAGGADVILIPEIPYDMAKVCASLQARSRRGKRFSILVVAEGAKPRGGKMVVARTEAASPDPVRLGGIGQVLARQFQERYGLDTRVTVLGHLQRGGSPLASDRVLCTRFGSKAAEFVASGLFGQMVALRGSDMIGVPLDQVAGRLRTVPTDHPLIAAARAVGTCFGVDRSAVQEEL